MGADRHGVIPELMGVLNVTPDSFSDGGAHVEPARAVARGREMLAEGAAWIDVGGESTRPGAAPVDVQTEIARVIPVIAGLRDRGAARCSVDTSKVEVADRAIDAGADAINDVTGGADPAMAKLAARRGVTLIVMHMRGTPATMQRDTRYADLLGEIRAFLAERAGRAVDAGVPADRVLVDPGLGFGKDPLDNPRILAHLGEIRALGFRVVVGASRKAFVGRLTGVEAPSSRVFGSIGAAIAAAERGADVLRVHDVGPTRQALVVWDACRGGRADPARA